MKHPNVHVICIIAIVIVSAVFNIVIMIVMTNNTKMPRYGATALHMAAAAGHLSTVKAVLEAGGHRCHHYCPHRHQHHYQFQCWEFI